MGEGFRLKLDKANTVKQSYMGVCLTCMIVGITLMFFYAKINTLVKKHDVDIMSALVDNEIDFDYKFTADQGFFISAALTNYNANTTLTEEARYGELIFEQFGWGN